MLGEPVVAESHRGRHKIPKLGHDDALIRIYVCSVRFHNDNSLMSHTYTASYFHCIFSTIERKNTIPDYLRPTLWAYIAGTAKNLGIVPVAIGGTSNHAHLLLGLDGG